MPRYTKRQQSKKQQSKRQMRGGSTSATTFAQEVYGSPENQRVDPVTHAIHMNQVTGGAEPVDLLQTNNYQTGGKKQQKRKGGKILTDIALPAVLILANDTFGKRRSQSQYTNKQSRRRRRTNRFRRSVRR